MFKKKQEVLNSENNKVGLIKTLMLRHQVESSNTTTSMETYDDQINHALAVLEEKGHQIIDVKFMAQTAPRATKMMDTIHTLIVYK